MIANIYNQNFGWSVACDSYWAAVGNPCTFRYNPLTESIIRTGSVEIYKYNINSDIHDFKTILYRPTTNIEEVLLSTEFANSSSGPQTGPYWYIHTEYTGSIPITADRDLLMDLGQYFTSSEDGYGFALDIKDAILAVGNPYFTSEITFNTTSFYFTGSGCVDVYDLSVLNVDPYIKRINPSIIGTGSMSGFVTIIIEVQPSQNYTYVIFQTKLYPAPESEWANIAIVPVSNDGGIFTIQTYYSPTDLSILDSRVVGVIGTNPYLTTIYNPNTSISNSFGYSLSLNDE